MNKIIAGVVGVALLTSVTASAAQSALSGTATVEGITISAGNADLQVYDPVATTYGPTWNTNLTLSNVYPGYTSAPTTLWLKNNSSAAISLAISAKLASAGGDWDAMKDKVSFDVFDGVTHEKHTLNEWYTTGYAFPGAAIAQGAEQSYTVTFSVDPTAGNEIAGKTVSNITFTLTGTQP